MVQQQVSEKVHAHTQEEEGKKAGNVHLSDIMY